MITDPREYRDAYNHYTDDLGYTHEQADHYAAQYVRVATKLRQAAPKADTARTMAVTGAILVVGVLLAAALTVTAP